MGLIWTIIIGFLAGVVAKFIMPGRNEPSGFILTTILGIIGAVVATYLGQAMGWLHRSRGRRRDRARRVGHARRPPLGLTPIRQQERSHEQ